MGAFMTMQFSFSIAQARMPEAEIDAQPYASVEAIEPVRLTWAIKAWSTQLIHKI